MDAVFEFDYKITWGIQNLYTEGLLFGTSTNRGKMLFKFANKDYSSFIAFDSNGLNNLVQMLRIIAMTISPKK